MSLLSTEGLGKTYSGVSVLSDISLQFHAGEVRALVGENGAGKSTFLKIVSGAVAPTSGTVMLDGVPLPAGDPRQAQARGVSIVYQEFTLVPDLTVADNIFLGRELGRIRLDRQAMAAAAQRILDQLGVQIDAGATVRGLSVAHQQMVEVARALAGQTRILILDEPTTSLSSQEVATLFTVVRQLRARGLAVIYVTHRLDEVFEIADNVTVLRDGRHILTSPVSGETRDSLIRAMVGRSLSEEFPERLASPGSVVFELANLQSPPGLRGASLTVREGEIVGLAGLVGAGRTSCALAAIGRRPSTGEVTLAGARAKFGSPADAIQAGVVYVTEDRKTSGIFPVMSVGANMTITHLRAFARRGLLSLSAEQQWISSAISRFSIRVSSVAQPMATLSGGNQQKALLSRYLVTPPRVLILDEPTRGVDVAARSEIYRMVNQLTAEGMGVLLISSDLPEILGMSDRLIVMRQGRTVGELRRPATGEQVMSLAVPSHA